MARTGRIYQITSKTSGKIYIGQTIKSLKDRLDAHWYCACRGSRTHLACALRKYGRDDFLLTVLEECSEHLLNIREIHHIARLNANHSAIGYNMSAGGDGGRNSLSLEVRKRISETKRGIRTGPPSFECRAKISAALRGKTRTPEQRARIRDSRSYPSLTDAHKQAIALGLRRTRVFILPDEVRLAIYAETLSEPSDLKLARKYGVNGKMVWRIRRNVNQCVPGLPAEVA